ncbi:MAG: helix-turn-helix domain-containing protein [Ruminococcus sp.]|jgi:transcriptional regulator with XRE-family HTH domain
MMNVNFKLIGKRIQEVRKQQAMTQAELAALTDMSDSYISCIETAKKQASLESLIRISNALGITVDELLSGNQLHNPTDYQTDIDLLMEDCSLLERRFIYELISVAKYIIRNNGWELIESKENH